MAGLGYNLVLLPEAGLAAKLVDYSQAMAQTCPSTYILGDASFPHMTVAQFQAEESELALLQDKLLKLSPPRCVTCNGLDVNPDPHKAATYATVRVERTPHLMAYQEAVIDALGGRDLYNGIGEAYFPHFTLARFNLLQYTPNLPLRAQILKAQNIPVHPALGISGNYHQLVSIIKEAPLHAA